jgi:hypothetical protein
MSVIFSSKEAAGVPPTKLVAFDKVAVLIGVAVVVQVAAVSST